MCEFWRVLSQGGSRCQYNIFSKMHLISTIKHLKCKNSSRYNSYSIFLGGNDVSELTKLQETYELSFFYGYLSRRNFVADLCCPLGLFKISETLEISSGDDVRGIFPIFSLWWVTHDKSSTASPTFGLPWRYIYQRWTGQLGFKGKRRERAWPSTRLAVSPTIGHLNPTWRRREELPRKMDFKLLVRA